VDDEEIIVNAVRNMLEHLGYKVTALMDSEEALRLFSANPAQFDLVMTDQTMPFMTGEDLGPSTQLAKMVMGRFMLAKTILRDLTKQDKRE
jgi:CheY-like chemotaxis protein